MMLFVLKYFLDVITRVIRFWAFLWGKFFWSLKQSFHVLYIYSDYLFLLESVFLFVSALFFIIPLVVFDFSWLYFLISQARMLGYWFGPFLLFDGDCLVSWMCCQLKNDDIHKFGEEAFIFHEVLQPEGWPFWETAKRGLWREAGNRHFKRVVNKTGIYPEQGG